MSGLGSVSPEYLGKSEVRNLCESGTTMRAGLRQMLLVMSMHWTGGGTFLVVGGTVVPVTFECATSWMAL